MRRENYFVFHANGDYGKQQFLCHVFVTIHCIFKSANKEWKGNSCSNKVKVSLRVEVHEGIFSIELVLTFFQNIFRLKMWNDVKKCRCVPSKSQKHTKQVSFNGAGPLLLSVKSFFGLTKVRDLIGKICMDSCFWKVVPLLPLKDEKVQRIKIVPILIARYVFWRCNGKSCQKGAVLSLFAFRFYLMLCLYSITTTVKRKLHRVKTTRI